MKREIYSFKLAFHLRTCTGGEKRKYAVATIERKIRDIERICKKKERGEGRRGGGRRSPSSNFFPFFDIVSLYLVRLLRTSISARTGEQPVLDIFLRRVLARTSYLSMWKQPRDEKRAEEHKGRKDG